MIKALARWILKEEIIDYEKQRQRIDEYRLMVSELMALPDRTQRHKSVVNKYLMKIEKIKEKNND